MPSTPYDIPVLLKAIHDNGTALSAGKEKARLQCLVAARSLCSALETPVESLLRLYYSEPAHQAAVRTAVELNLFKIIADKDGQPIHTSELAEDTHAEPKLLARVLKHLAAMGTLYEVDVDTFLPTPLSQEMTRLEYEEGFPQSPDVLGPAFGNLHDFLSKTRYKNPENPHDAPFQTGHTTNAHFLEWLEERSQHMWEFNNRMEVTRAGFPNWMDEDFFLFERNLVKGTAADEEATFFVDVGSGTGHDLQRLCLSHPHLPGRLILQDQAMVINEAYDLDTRIYEMAHDIFKPQPVKGARTYYLRRVLHDWPDAKCLEILAHLKPAMRKGYSKRLINEHVIPDRGASMLATGLDITMMSLFSSCERTEKDWRTLLDRAGFKVLNIWYVAPASESLIEAEVA